MASLNKISLSVALLSLFSTPSYAFLDGLTSVANNLIDSTESVTNNTVNNANSTAQLLASNPGKMADRIGLMADRIGYMGDRIVTTEGLMSGLAHKIIDGPNKQQQRAAQQPFGFGFPMASAPAPVSQPSGFGWGFNQPAPVQHVNANPYMPGFATAPAQGYGYANPSNERYSASNMIFGQSGTTYTAQRQAPQPVPFGFQANNYQPGYAAQRQAPQPAPFGFQAQYSQPGYAAPGFGYGNQPTIAASNGNCGYAYGVALNCR